MKGCFAFRFEEVNARKRESLVLFFSSDVSADIVVKAVKDDVEKNLVPALIYLIGPESRKDEIKSLSNDTSLLSEIDSFVGEPVEKLKLLTFDGAGAINCVLDNLVLPADVRRRLIISGAGKIFEKRKGLIVSASNFHFLKPSGDHCNSFIRASNLLISGDEVAFLAIALLPYLTEALKTIYVDTSSISYLVSVAISMSGRYKESSPTIESFESYAALNQRFDFVEDKSSLVLISATTSGSLAGKIKKQTSFEQSQIITLFYSKLMQGQEGIFDISGLGSASIKSYKPEDCDLCKEGSRLIRIVGDQFLPETPANEQFLIRKVDFSKAREAFFEEYAAKGILKWSVLPNMESSSREHFFIDVEKSLESPSKQFSASLDFSVNKYFSRHVGTVISLNDPGSLTLAELIRKKVEQVEGVKWISIDEIASEGIDPKSSVVVVAGAVTSGRKLLDASRRLRILDRAASITYIVGFSKLPTDPDLEQLRKDIEMGGHQLIVLRKCPMPRISSKTRTPWDVELKSLQDWDPDNPFCKGSLPTILVDRLKELKISTPDNTKIFLPTSSGSSLKLRQTFAFWSGIPVSTDDATQADVYWTIQAILHDLRMKAEGGLGSAYHTTVISPTCFDRYNDGVIQAALLRSASPLELNYSVDEVFSQKMFDVLISILEHIDEDQGEAAFEFLFAIWTGKLKLYEAHTKEILRRFNVIGVNETAKFFLERISERFGPSGC